MTTTFRRTLPSGVTGMLTGVLAIALLAGCGGTGDKKDAAASASASATVSTAASASPSGEPTSSSAPATPSAAPSTASAADHNAADVSFARMMIPHHLQAIDMATLAGTHAMDQWIRDMATEITDAQDPQIRTLKSRLDAWGAEPLPRDHQMPGMQSRADISALAAIQGSEFDRKFLTMMIEHHQGAIQMAKVEQSTGVSADVTEMAASIVSTQQAEIKKMRAYLAALK